MRHAYENVPFYHRRLDQAGINPDEIRSVNDLSRLPVTTKSEIQASSPEDLVARNVDLSECVRASTSGSTGLPLSVFCSESEEDFRRALWDRALLENGLRITDKVAMIKNPHFFDKNKGLFRLLRRKYISVFEDLDRMSQILEDYEPDVIRGYPSSLAMLADASRKRGGKIRPRLVFTGSELLHAKSRKEISSVFGCDMFDYYGCVELSLLMWECGEHVGYHMNVDSVVTEFLNQGEVVGPGEKGEIVCTSLHNYAMPLIRYNLGDVGVPTDERCPCGRTLPLSRMLEGRSDEMLHTLNDKFVFSSSFFYNLFWHFEGIGQFKVIQEKRDKLSILLVPKYDSSISDVLLEKAKREIRTSLGQKMKVDFRIVDKIEKDPTGKLRVFVSHVCGA